MALMQLNVVPLGTGTTSIGTFVVEIQKALQEEEVNYTLTDMGTTIEGEIPQLLALAAKIHALPFAQGAQRVFTQITIDDRRDKSVALGDKIHSVQERL